MQKEEWRKARKRPVTIEFREVLPKTDLFWVPDMWIKGEVIPTKEGTLTAKVGEDYIIKGVEGELYPIAKGIFHKTYTLLDCNENILETRVICPKCNVLCILKHQSTVKLNTSEEMLVWDDSCWSCKTKFPKIEVAPENEKAIQIVKRKFLEKFLYPDRFYGKNELQVLIKKIFDEIEEETKSAR